jgi:nucleoid-associated protein YgaU
MKRLVGVLASLALTLGLVSLATPPASAASTVWDKVARCESGGNWKINTGNGYYGGLQFSGRTWKGFGGGKYASKAHKATKGEQIAVARRVLAGQGPGAWATCSRKAGLTKSNGKASKSATPSSNPGAKKSTAKKSSPKKSTAKKKAAKKSTAKKKASTSKAAKAKTVRVKSGDTLAKIAKRHSVKGGWKGLWKLNKKKLKNPNRIKVGQVLRLR